LALSGDDIRRIIRDFRASVSARIETRLNDLEAA